MAKCWIFIADAGGEGDDWGGRSDGWNWKIIKERLISHYTE
jgi:hypothetical protein